MALKVWIDENDTLYLVGKDREWGYTHEIRTAPAHLSLKAANDHLDEVDSEGSYRRITFADIYRFQTLWVFPDAIDKEVWASSDFAVTVNDQEDSWFESKGLIPVMTFDLAVTL